MSTGLAVGQAAGNKAWTVQEIFRDGGIAAKPPEGVTWSPDSTQATYLASDGDVMRVSLAKPEPSVLVSHTRLAALNNSNISEQDKDHRVRYGQASYIWAPDSLHLLFDTDGELWLYDLKNNTGIEVGNTGSGSGDDPKFSPNGHYISYIRDRNLFIHALRDPAPPLALTNYHEPTMLDGVVDWVYDEELDVRSNYFWSPDSKQIAYLQMNEADVPQYPLTDWIPTHAAVEMQRYPQPGDPNPAVRVGVVSTTSPKTVWLKVPLESGNDYIPRFGWLTPKMIWVETLSRDHKHLNLYLADARTGEAKLVLAQTDDKFFDEAYDITFVGSSKFLITSWKDGHTHIYLYSVNSGDVTSAEAKLEGQLEHGEYEVDSIKSVDEATHTVYYLSNEGNAREQQIWAVELDGSKKRQVSKPDGFHSPNFADDGSAWVDTASDANTPPRLSICGSHAECREFWHTEVAAGHTLSPPEMLELKAADGTTKLYGELALPEGKSPASVPLIVNPYGGPHAQSVRNAWGSTGHVFDQLLTEHGFAVLHVDNRGMAARGRDFEQAAYHNFGPVQLSDQLAAVDQVLDKYPQLDRHRLGWWGWSWGGTFTLYAMSHSDRFIAGVCVAPVTDWKNYDSIYTERYLGLPSQNSEGYRENSVVGSAKDIKGSLLLVHGTGDDNVHIENTIQFIQQLVDADVPYRLLVYPRKTHSIAGPEARTHLFSAILDQFETHLMHATPPAAATGGAAE
jgi:dipeptidyl-peptidase-4